MQNTLKSCMNVLAGNRKRRYRGVAILCALSLLVSAQVFWGLRQTGLTLTDEASCGLENHTHTAECEERVLICGFSDETTGVDKISGADGTTDADREFDADELFAIVNDDATSLSDVETPVESATHVHTDECYEIRYICGKTAHIHTVDCYADESADVETQLDWQKAFAKYSTGDLRADLVELATSQIGYTESERNYQVTDGERRGYTRYGAWYGSPYGDWSATFVSFCLHYAGSPSEETPYNIGADSMARLWEKAGRYAEPDEYDPEAGDLIFFADNAVGIIEKVYYDVLTVIQGDVDGAVVERVVMDYEDAVVGYGILVLPDYSANAFAISTSTAELPAITDCNCGNPTKDDPSEHADSCDYKKGFQILANEKNAEELCALWNSLEDLEKQYVLNWLQWNDSEKYASLSALLEDSGGDLTASLNGVSFSASGALPAGATLQVSDPGYTEDAKRSFINPNILDSVRWYAVYDISVLVDNAEYEPDAPVSVSVTSSDFVVGEEELFCVAHLDEATGTVLSSEYVAVVDNTITFTTNSFSPWLFYIVDQEVEGGERILGTNWIKLRDSGFFTYWEDKLNADGISTLSTDFGVMPQSIDGDDPSDEQIDEWGGETVSDDGKVTVSKTIDGTDVENVFDITLTVQTEENIADVYKEPDMAVVIVMDISNTMKDNFGGETRYEAAMKAAEDFLDNFVANTSGVSRVGYVAFNTDAHQIFDLSPCSTETEAAALKNTMRQNTGEIINASGYGTAHNRFTNIEGGLKLGADMLAKASNENKYIILLTDGFPTTYVSSGYNGYDPYTGSGTVGRDGVFYDSVLKVYCSSGTSYSDKAAIRARTKATEIKNSGISIFSIGVDVGGQTIQKYINSSESFGSFSIVDRTSTSYEIGSATSTEAYKTWLQNSIGSGEGYYYDSTDAEALKKAYADIFEKIHTSIEEASKADWVAEDPLPTTKPESFEFIGFYDKDGTLQKSDVDLQGTFSINGENTANFDEEKSEILWDLKKSGYTTETDGGKTTYYYQMVYRVRLKNETTGFVEGKVYETNAPTTLTYKVIEKNNDVLTLSETRTVDFKIPAVHGYLADFTFTKKDTLNRPLEGASFTLSHDTTTCAVCRGDGKSAVVIADFTATSDANGKVSFTDIPSGHVYALRETAAPPGFVSDGITYAATVAYDKITVSFRNKDGTLGTWNGEIVNEPIPYELPTTGGSGYAPTLFTGAILIVVPTTVGYFRYRRRRT